MDQHKPNRRARHPSWPVADLSGLSQRLLDPALRLLFAGKNGISFTIRCATLNSS
jgi:hypothetical protein